jgi:membrane-associated phospholipid phosphatase
MKYVELYEANAKKYNNRPQLKRAIILFNQCLPLLFLIFYIGFFVCAIFFDIPSETLKKNFPTFVFAPLASLAIVSALRLLVARPRPYSEEGANITPMIQKKSDKYTSCPSRHMACAMAIALAFAPFSLPITIFLAIASVALGYLRFTVGVHYISDLIAGASIPFVFYAFMLVLQLFM